jgi:histidinol dehydrogenase
MAKYKWNDLSSKKMKKALMRSKQSIDPLVGTKVAEIINAIEHDGDIALKKFSKLYDDFDGDDYRVHSSIINGAYDKLNDSMVNAIESAWTQIYKFHDAQPDQDYNITTWSGVICSSVSKPIQQVGLYIPAGSAPLISTTMMLLVPAIIACVPRIALFSPPDKNGNIHPAILYVASKHEGIEVYKIGGAHAIAAMAYGTSSIPKVDKIFGPGNIWVTEAKRQISSRSCSVSIDMPAGPSEVMVIADQTANIDFVAADLLSQCEHGGSSQAILVTSSLEIFNTINTVIAKQLPALSRKEIIKESLENIRIIFIADINDAINIINDYAPEHLIINTDNSDKILASVVNAGSVFMGPYSPETAGDYCSGTNHVLPTYGTAKSISGLSVKDFKKTMLIQKISKNGLNNMYSCLNELTKAEGLDAHMNAINVRLKNES